MEAEEAKREMEDPELLAKVRKRRRRGGGRGGGGCCYERSMCLSGYVRVCVTNKGCLYLSYLSMCLLPPSLPPSHHLLPSSSLLRLLLLLLSEQAVYCVMG